MVNTQYRRGASQSAEEDTPPSHHFIIWAAALILIGLAGALWILAAIFITSKPEDLIHGLGILLFDGFVWIAGLYGLSKRRTIK